MTALFSCLGYEESNAGITYKKERRKRPWAILRQASYMGILSGETAEKSLKISVIFPE
jgi:hypothetical protein